MYRIIAIIVGYFVMSSTVFAISGDACGYLQFSTANITVERIQGMLPITVKRLGGNMGKVSTNIRYQGKILKTLVWEDGDSSDKTFIAGVNTQRTGTADLTLSNVYGGARLGEIDATHINIVSPSNETSIIYNANAKEDSISSAPLITPTPSDILSVYVQSPEVPAFVDEAYSFTITINSDGSVNNAVLTISFPINITVSSVSDCGDNASFDNGLLTCYVDLGEGVTSNTRIVTIVPNNEEDITIIAEIKTDGELMFDTNSSNNFQVVTTPVTLGSRYYLLGATVGDSSTQFQGAILADNGESLQGAISASHTVDMNIWFELDARHIGKQGGVITVAMLDDMLLQRTAEGTFTPWDGRFETLIQNAEIKTLNALEVVHLLNDLSLEGTEGHQFMVIAGYFLADEEVIYYHDTPLTLTVTE